MNTENALPNMSRIKFNYTGIQLQLSTKLVNQITSSNILKEKIVIFCAMYKLYYTQSIDAGILPSDCS